MAYPDLPGSVGELEEELLRRWGEERLYRRSVDARRGQPEYVFYEGPPTANGRPGVHHIFARTIKDLAARHRTMTGHHVPRKAGWDTHGLPVEIDAERQLGISGKSEIEKLGIAEFNRVCRENLFTYKQDWERLSRRIGYWLDYEDPYITCSPDYIESAWWAVSEIDRKGLLYKGYKVLPYCPRCGTGLSSHEVAQGYEDIEDTAVYAAFPLLEDPEGAAILSWTTTPWTLPGNVALAVHPDIEYVRVRVTAASEEALAREGDVLILARARMEDVLRNSMVVEDAFPGTALLGRRYRPPFEGAVDAGDSDTAWSVLPADFVTVEEGTGVVHTSVMYGEDDFELGTREGLPMQHTVGQDGCFLDNVPGGLAGRPVNEADTEALILDRLGRVGALYRVERYRHSYPHCWRCDSKLLYMACDSWYIRTTAVTDHLLENNDSVSWHPPEIGTGRMGEWLKGNVDWALSRDRFWGTPLPVWECDAHPEHRNVVGSFAELEERAGELPPDFDPHRPEIDDPSWACPEADCSGTMRRVPQVLDAWFDSGSMPYAQWHWPFENEEAFRRHFPADFIAEGLDQTRGWFYSLLALSTILFGRSPYRAVVVNDLVLDADGHKMSKSRGNTVDPWEALGRHGADAIRWYLLSSSNPWISKRWDPDGIDEVGRKFFDTLRNTYRFFALYANLESWTHEEPGARPAEERTAMDRWLLSRLDQTVEAVGEALEDYDPTPAARRLSDFVVDELSNWYVRRTRPRFWATRRTGDSDQSARDAFATLHEALATIGLLLAPFSPFLSDWLHRALRGDSVHLADFPTALGRRDPELEQGMTDVRELATLGRAAREKAGIRVRQPLRRVRVVLPEGRRVPADLLIQLREELNVKGVDFIDDENEIVRLIVKPDYAALGPRFGAGTPAVARAIEGLEPAAARQLRAGHDVAVATERGEIELRPSDVRILEQTGDELTAGSAAGYVTSLDPSLDEALRAEGLARELVSRVQRMRRDAGLAVEDRIRLVVAGDADVETAASAHRDAIAGETLALRLDVDGAAVDGLEHCRELEIDGHRVRIGLERAGEVDEAPEAGTA
jgi:isoleucyl-tRNA synthetase